MTARIDLADLELGAELDRGGQGRVFPVLRRTGDHGQPLVYKQYEPEFLAALDADALSRLVDLPRSSPGDEDWLRERTAWPLVLVEDRGRVAGFLMQAIPADFRFAFQTSPGATSARLCQYAFLLNSEAYVQSSGLVVTDQDRFLLLADVASALDRLHRLGVAVGDLSPKNLLFAADRSHRTFFIDCDSVRLGDASVLPQAHTPDWEPPSGEEPGTAAADRYKFGLLAIRLFARSQTSRDVSAIGAFSPYLGHLAQASLDPDPARRPAPADWLEALMEGARTAALQQSGAAYARTQAGGGPSGPVPGRPQRNRVGLAALAAALAVVLIGGGITALSVYEHHEQSVATTSSVGSGVGAADTESPVDPDGAPAPDTTIPATSASPSPSPTVGIVTIDSSIVGDPRAQQVATMFDLYFSGIDDQDYTQAFDQLDPDVRGDEQSFQTGVDTSSDTEVMLNSLSPDGPDPATTADVTFQSTQDAADGPGDSQETCTVWSLTYTLSYDSGGGDYLIASSSGTSTSC